MQMKARRWDILRLAWAIIWCVPFAVTYALLMAIAFVGFGKRVTKDVKGDFR